MDQGNLALILLHKDRTKKVLIQRTELSTKAISDIVRNKFSLNDDFFMQYYDTDVDEYIDVDDDSLNFIKNEKFVKIKIFSIIKSRKTLEDNHSLNGDPEQESNNSTLNAELDNDSAMSDGASHHGNRSHCSSPMTMTYPDLPSTPSTKSSGTASECTEPRVPVCLTPKSDGRKENETVTPTGTEKKKRRPWPKLYSMPKNNLSRSLLMKLENKQPLDRSDRRILMEAIYHDVSSYEGGVYPTPTMYDEIVDGLLREFNYLVAMTELPASSARVYWKDKVMNKFGNSRRRVDKYLPEVQEKKRKKEKSTEVQASPKETPLVWGLANYLPEMPPSEDEHSMSMHKLWLQKEKRNLNKDLNAISNRMDLTFADRRKLIIQDNAKISDILKEYPCLKIYQQLMMEFTRLGPNTQSKDLEKLFYDGLDKYAEAIVSIIQKRKVDNMLKQVLDSLSSLRIDEQRKYTCRCAALLGLPVLFKEKINTILVHEADPSGADKGCSVRMVMKTDVLSLEENAFAVHVEDQTVVCCDNFLEMMLAFIAAIYTFNLAYPKKIEKTMLFIQKIILGLMDSDLIDRKFLNVLSELKNAEKAKDN